MWHCDDLCVCILRFCSFIELIACAKSCRDFRRNVRSLKCRCLACEIENRVSQATCPRPIVYSLRGVWQILGGRIRSLSYESLYFHVYKDVMVVGKDDTLLVLKELIFLLARMQALQLVHVSVEEKLAIRDVFLYLGARRDALFSIAPSKKRRII